MPVETNLPTHSTLLPVIFFTKIGFETASEGENDSKMSLLLQLGNVSL